MARLQHVFLEGKSQAPTREPGEVLERKREVFYDTDGIFERQREFIRGCRDCAGTLGVESAASTGNHIFGMHIHAGVCEACRQAALSMVRPGRRGIVQSRVSSGPGQAHVRTDLPVNTHLPRSSRACRESTFETMPAQADAYGSESFPLSPAIW